MLGYGQAAVLNRMANLTDNEKRDLKETARLRYITEGRLDWAKEGDTYTKYVIENFAKNAEALYFGTDQIYNKALPWIKNIEELGKL